MAGTAVSGIQATREILQFAPNTRILILTMYDFALREAVDAGARGFVLKYNIDRYLLPAIETLARGGTFFPTGAMRNPGWKLAA